jgi:hypothetical protein
MTAAEEKSKTPVLVKIPDNLVLYFKRVSQDISNQSKAITTESDDLIQYEEYDFAYGGLVDTDVDKFRFTYFTDDKNDSTWQIDLSSSEIKKAATGKTKILNLWTCHTTWCGGMFSDKDELCSNCD